MLLAGMPAVVMPDNWPGFDVMALHPHGSNTNRRSH
jgi:hypothetical protein